MKTIQDEFVSFYIATKLKELGFSERCYTWYNQRGVFDFGMNTKLGRDYNKLMYCSSAPLWQQAIDFLNTKGYYIDIHPVLPTNDNGIAYSYTIRMVNDKNLDTIWYNVIILEVMYDKKKVIEQAILKTLILIEQ